MHKLICKSQWLCLTAFTACCDDEGARVSILNVNGCRHVLLNLRDVLLNHLVYAIGNADAIGRYWMQAYFLLVILKL